MHCIWRNWTATLSGFARGIEVHNEALGDEAVAYGKHLAPAGSYHAAVVASFAL